MDDCNKRIFSGHDREVSRISQQLWLHAQHLRKTKPEQLSAWMGEWFMKSHSYLRSSCQLMTSGSVQVSFLHVIAPPPREATHDPVDIWYVQYRSSVYTCAHWQHLSGLSELKKTNIWNEENNGWDIRMGGRNWVGIWYEFYQNTYAYMKSKQ